MADDVNPDRTRRVAAKVRKQLSGMMIKHKTPDAASSPGTAENTADAMAQLSPGGEGKDSEGNEKKLHQDLPMHMNLSDGDADDKGKAADAMPARRSKVVRSLTDAYKKSK